LLQVASDPVGPIPRDNSQPSLEPPWPILYEDNHLLVVVKPAMLPTMGVSPEKESLLSQAKQYIKQKYQKPGNVYLGIVSRLDAPVSGVLVLARTSKAAARLTEQFRARQVEKTYWCVVHGVIRPPAGKLVDFLKHQERHRRVRVIPPSESGAKRAELDYRTLLPLEEGTLLHVELQTGRKHQIRVQLAHAGHPVLGDRKYGSRRPLGHGIALHARRLRFLHPTRREPIDLVAPLPSSWAELRINERDPRLR